MHIVEYIYIYTYVYYIDHDIYIYIIEYKALFREYIASPNGSLARNLNLLPTQEPN